MSSGDVGAVGTATVVYVNADGPTLQGGGDSSDATEDLVEGEFPSGAFAAADPVRVAELVERIDTALGGYGVDVTADRPPEGTEYMMLVVTAEPTPIHGFISLAGLDCGNSNPHDVGILFDDPSNAPSMARLARGAAYAIGLMLGLHPTEDPSDAMFPELGEEPILFVDACVPIATNIECEPEPRSCSSGLSNSHAELQLALG